MRCVMLSETKNLIGKDLTALCCHSEKPQATWESQYTNCHSEEGRMPDRGSLAVGNAVARGCLPTKKEILTSRA